VHALAVLHGASCVITETLLLGVACVIKCLHTR
jgi:hypothetical protein